VRVAALYDIHGNLPALEAVVAEVEREQPDAIVFGGDIIAGPMPRETLELVREDVARRLREAAGTRSRDSSVIEDLVRPPSREEVLDFFDRMAAEQRGA
jgi:Icc-related predicted phosphoesterase